MTQIKMFNEDCMAAMAKMPDKAFELAIADPPYGIGIANRRCVGGQIKPGHKRNGVAAPSTEFKIGTWDNSTPPDLYFAELFRVSKNQIIWGGNYFNLPPTSCYIVWDKINDGSDFADAELAWASFKKAVRQFRYMWNGMMQGQSGNGKIPEGNHAKKEKRIHPTQKPVALYKWLLQNYAKPGDRILDTHGGSGSICIACNDLGFDLTWMELDKDYYDAAVKRFEKHKQQGSLFKPDLTPAATQGELI